MYKGKGGLTERMCKTPNGAAWYAIKMCSNETDRSHTLLSLERNLINGLYHTALATIAGVVLISALRPEKICSRLLP